MLYQTILSTTLTYNEKLERLTRAIQLTCPKYNSNSIPHILSYEEIIILNNIAVCYGNSGQLEKAISLLKKLKQHYDNHMVNQEEILRTQLLVLYNYSKYLGNADRLDECIEICDFGIRVSRESRRCNRLDTVMYPARCRSTVRTSWKVLSRMFTLSLGFRAQSASENKGKTGGPETAVKSRVLPPRVTL